MNSFQAGFAEVDFTPAPGLPLLGQMHERIATHARDPLCACAAAFSDETQTVVLVAVDVCVLDNEFVAQARAQWAHLSGLPPHSLWIHATHTHVAPISTGALMSGPLPDFQEHLTVAILKSAGEALKNREPAELFAATGSLDFMGWNRRAMYQDGTSRMYGDSTNEGFIGLEGPRDAALPLLWTRDASGAVTGVIANFATHPNCLEGESFYSADIPGAARKHLKAMLGDIGALYLTGAAGNTAPSRLDPLDPQQSWRGESGVERSGLYLAGEAFKLIAATDQPMPSPQVRAAHCTLQVPLRDWPQPGEPGAIEPGTWGESLSYYADAREAWPERMQTHSPASVEVGVLRLGDALLCANPAELFVEFGLQMRQASPERVMLISELTNGYCGYVPTAKAFSRGGYETWTAPSSQLASDAGDQIVEATRELLQEVF